MDEILKALMEFLKEASPMVWNALVRQVHAEAVEYMVWAVVSLIAGTSLWVISVKFAEAADDESVEWICRIVVGIILFAFVALVICGAKRFYNPDYYAIRLILEALGR